MHDGVVASDCQSDDDEDEQKDQTWPLSCLHCQGD